MLGRSGCNDTGNTFSGDHQGTTGALSAAHGQNDCFGFHFKQSFFWVDCADDFLWGNIQCKGVGQTFDLQVCGFFCNPLCEFYSGQIFFIFMDTKSVVDTLTEDSTKIRTSLQYQNIFDALLFRLNCGGKSGSTAAYDYKIFLYHQSFPPFSTQAFPTRILECPPDCVISSGVFPSSSQRISRTRGLQNPP